MNLSLKLETNGSMILPFSEITAKIKTDMSKKFKNLKIPSLTLKSVLSKKNKKKMNS